MRVGLCVDWPHALAQFWFSTSRVHKHTSADNAPSPLPLILLVQFCDFKIFHGVLMLRFADCLLIERGMTGPHCYLACDRLQERKQAFELHPGER
jgi:hypothetical protein